VTILVGENPAVPSGLPVTAKQKDIPRSWDSFNPGQPGSDITEETTSRPYLESTTGIRNHTDPCFSFPLPKAHPMRRRVLYAIDPQQGRGRLPSVNVGKLVIGEANFYPCTPYGIQQLLVAKRVATDGAEVRDRRPGAILWGKPIANMMLQKAKGANATVTICHTATKDIAFHTKRADILIVAAGRPKGHHGGYGEGGALSSTWA